MNFVAGPTLANQTLIITPRFAGQVIRLAGVETVATAAETPMRVYGSGLVEFGEGWWDNMGVFAGNYTGPGFDGSTPYAGDSDLNKYAWTGTPNASTSLFQTRTRIGSPVKTAKMFKAPWIGGQGHSGCRFEGVPTYVTNSGLNGGRIGFAATFREVGAWTSSG